MPKSNVKDATAVVLKNLRMQPQEVLTIKIRATAEQAVLMLLSNQRYMIVNRQDLVAQFGALMQAATNDAILTYEEKAG